MPNMQQKAARLLNRVMVVDGILRYYDLAECGWKYETAEVMCFQTDIYPEQDICYPVPTEDDSPDDIPWVALGKNGMIVFREAFTWDGASGPTVDTKSSMRGALIHDGLYQLMGAGLLDEKWRKRADEILEEWCAKDRMISWRARTWYFFVHMFGGGSAKAGRKDPVVDKIHTAP